jgi:hypothetical protein
MSTIEEISDNVKAYLGLRLEMLRLKATAMASGILANHIVVLYLTGMVLICLLFLAVALAIYLSDLFESAAAGFGATGAVLTIITAIVVLLRRKLLFGPLRDRFIRDLLGHDEKEK